MYNLLVYLKVVAEYSKDVHYNLSGLPFLENHEYMDKVNSEALEYIDEINEQYYMYNDLPVPPAKEIMAEAIKLIPEVGSDKEMIERLLNAIKAIIYQAEEIKAENDKALGDLLGRLSSSFAKHYGLLLRITK